MTDKTASAFLEFSVDDWRDWLNAVLAGLPATPQLELGTEELNGVLLGLYENLTTKKYRDRFAEALFQVYESTPYLEGHEEVLYVILNLLASIKPARAKELLMRHLIGEEALNLQLDSTAKDESLPERKRITRPEMLHTLLLSVLGEYAPEEPLRRYIYHSTARINDLNYKLVCFRVLAADDETAGYELIPQILPSINQEADAEDLAFEIKAELKRYHYKNFCSWYSENASRIANQFPRQFALLEDCLRDNAIPPIFDIPSELNLYAKLLAAQLHANRVRYSAEEIVKIARLHTAFGGDLIFGVLRNIWRRSCSAWPEPAWTYVTINELFVGGYSVVSDKRVLEVRGEKGQPVEFSVKDEPELETIFERIESVHVLGDDIDEIERQFGLEDAVPTGQAK